MDLNLCSEQNKKIKCFKNASSSSCLIVQIHCFYLKFVLNFLKLYILTGAFKTNFNLILLPHKDFYFLLYFHVSDFQIQFFVIFYFIDFSVPLECGVNDVCLSMTILTKTFQYNL